MEKEEKKSTIVFTNLGRNKVCKTVELNLAKDTEEQIITQAKYDLVSQDISISEFEENKFKIFAGFNYVGKAELI